MSDSHSKLAYQKTLRKLFGGNDEKKVFIISGSPGSGKSYYAEKHKGENDIVFDMDKICSAIDGKNVHDDHRAIYLILFLICVIQFLKILLLEKERGEMLLLYLRPRTKSI